MYIYVIYIPWLRGAKVLYSPYTPRRHGTYNIFSNLQKHAKYTIVAMFAVYTYLCS